LDEWKDIPAESILCCKPSVCHQTRGLDFESSVKDKLPPYWNIFNYKVRISCCSCTAMLCCAVRCCAVLFCAVLCCSVLCCAVLCCAVLCGAQVCNTLN
jgi:hypothetical protein